MVDGVTTRLQKKVTQLQKEMERMDVKLEGKLEKLGEKLSEKMQLDLQKGLQQGLANISAKLKSLIKQCLSQSEETAFGKKVSEVFNSRSHGILQNSGASLSGPEDYQGQGNGVSMMPNSNSISSNLDFLRINSKRSKLECPRFDGYDFLGWFLKME